MLEKAFQSLMNKIMMMIGRGILDSVDNAQGTQRLRLKMLAGEILKNVEHIEEYGFTSYPVEGAEVAAMFVGGRRQHGIVTKVHDRRYRPQDLSEGESCMYTKEDSSGSGHRVHLKDDRSVEIIADEIDITADSDKIEGVGGNMTVTVVGTSSETATTKTITATTVNIVASTITLGGPGAKALLNETAINIINNHTHDEHDGYTTAGPNSTLSVGSNCTSTAKAL